MTDWNVISVVSWLDDMVTVPNIVVVQFPCKPSGKVQLWLSEKGSNYGDRDLDKLNSFQRLCDQYCILKFWTICVSGTLHFNIENWSCPLFNDSPTHKNLTLVENWSTIGITWITCPCHNIIGSFVQSTLGTRLLQAGHVSTLKTHPNISRIKPMPYRWNIKMSVFFFRFLCDKHLENTSVLYLFTILYH